MLRTWNPLEHDLPRLNLDCSKTERLRHQRLRESSIYNPLQELQPGK